MPDIVISEDEEAAIQSFPFNNIGLLIGAFSAGIGLFLIGSPTSGPITSIVGFILFLIGVVIFAL